MTADIKWGPAILSEGKWYLFQGHRRVIPIDVQDANAFLQKLRNIENICWAYSLPGQKQEMFIQQLHDVVAVTQMNWASGALLVCCVASTVFIFVAAISEIRARL